jgi:hypothetical protein
MTTHFLCVVFTCYAIENELQSVASVKKKQEAAQPKTAEKGCSTKKNSKTPKTD